MVFSEKLQLIRKNKGLTQEELAEYTKQRRSGMERR